MIGQAIRRCIVALTISVLAQSAFAQTPPEVIAEIKAIAQKSKDAYDRIKTINAKGTVVITAFHDPAMFPAATPIPKGDRITRGAYEWARDGEKYRFAEDVVDEVPSAGYKDVYKRYHARNEDYYAYSLEANKINTEPDARIGGDAKHTLANVVWNYDPRTLGFTIGHDKTFLVDNLVHNQDVLRWTLDTESDADGTLHIVTKVNPALHGTVDAKTRYEIDPDKGYLLTRVQVWDEYGELMTSVDVEPKQLPDGSWFPVKGTRVWNGTISFDITEVEINAAIPQKTFTFESFPFDLTQTTLQSRREGGRPERFVFRDGEWVARE